MAQGTDELYRTEFNAKFSDGRVEPGFFMTNQELSDETLTTTAIAQVQQGNPTTSFTVEFTSKNAKQN